MSNLENVKALLEIDDTSKDSILNVYINRATQYAKNHCNIPNEESVPSGLNGVIEDIAILKYRLKGVEGIKSEGKGSLSESYIEDLPPYTKAELSKFRRIVLKWD